MVTESFFAFLCIAHFLFFLLHALPLSRAALRVRLEVNLVLVRVVVVHPRKVEDLVAVFVFIFVSVAENRRVILNAGKTMQQCSAKKDVWRKINGEWR